MKRILLVALVLAFAAPAAHAENNCASSLVIFSYHTTPAVQRNSPNNNALWCVVDPNPDPDTRLINPTADSIQVRWTTDLGAAVPTLTVVLDGLGFDHEIVEMKRGNGTTSVVYDSAVYPLADGSAASGCLTAVLYDTNSDPDMLEALDFNTFHTIDTQVDGC